MAPTSDASRNATGLTRTHSELVEAELVRIGEHAKEQRIKRIEHVSRAVRDSSDQCPDERRIGFSLRPGTPVGRTGATDLNFGLRISDCGIS